MTDYRDEIIQIANEKLNQFPQNTLIAKSIVLYASIHRFIRLNNAVDMLLKDNNYDSIQYLLRPMLDCIMRMYIISARDDADYICEKILEGISLNKVYRGKDKITDASIYDEMSSSIFFKKINILYNKLNSYTHFSNMHILNTIAMNGDDIKIQIGSNNILINNALVNDITCDLNYIKDVFRQTLKYL